MLLCFNRGYVKQMAALPLQVISIGTAINFVVPRCGAAEILLKLSFELTAFSGQKASSLSTSALGDTQVGAASFTSPARGPTF